MSSLVPGFAQRYPRIDDDEAYWRDFERQATPDSARHAGLDPDCHAGLDPASLTIESCCTSLNEALAAEARGASRIELCTNLTFGGLTPPRDLIREVVDRLSIPVNVLIRPGPSGTLRLSLQERLAPLDPSQAELGPLPLTVPRVAWFLERNPSASITDGAERISGFTAVDFVYDEASLCQMESDIAFCRKAGAAGVVVGALTPAGAIDMPAMQRLVAAAGPLSVTFHRAFDVCSEDPVEAVDKIISLVCTRLLTSGKAPTAWEGRELIASIVRHAGNRLIIMPGSGVRPENLQALAACTQASEFHGTAIP